MAEGARGREAARLRSQAQWRWRLMDSHARGMTTGKKEPCRHGDADLGASTVLILRVPPLQPLKVLRQMWLPVRDRSEDGQWQ